MDFLNPLLMVTKPSERLGIPVGEWSYLLFQIATAKLPVELEMRFDQRYGSDPRALPIFDQLVGFLEEKNRLLNNIPREVRESSANAGRRVIFDQGAGRSGCRIKTTPPLWRESNSKPRSIYAAERNQRWCPFCEAGGHELTSCGRFYNENPYKRNADCVRSGAKRTRQTAGPSRQHCGPANPVGDGVVNIRTRRKSP
ncbi:hypothetical protein EVAR_87855_1 [Eumeta japonica]|uniref:Uncharacterized protein n=1 Tax=Eumeta variegata TaxID=151549 RepID=A0A4C1WV57_EUMVA|nr:hypothetical protein EVAR_87855_1 [Eumeta japonica]